jgi:hypothetical protein
MRLRVRPDVWATSLFLALGLLSVTACGGSSDEDGVNQFPCENPTTTGAGSGFATCDNGAVVRESVQQCGSSLPRPEAQAATLATGGCMYDSDCTEQANGYCAVNTFPGGDASGAYCYYGCTSDAECGEGNICVCGEPVGRCAQAKCSSDNDCGEGFHCASYDASGGCDIQGFVCQKPNDECLVNADCAGALCRFDETKGARVCGGGGCAIGRPFLVDEVARVASTAQRDDWLAVGLTPDLERLTPELRLRLRQEWTRSAQLEHASIAAFSRFLMELLAFGAPSELVAETVSAIEDERQHAQLCFTLASEFAGEVIGPGALDVGGALQAPSLGRSLSTAVREGCIGETIAALEAAELATHVVDPLLAQVLERIAADERRHSELAWKFAQWALGQDPGLADVLESELSLVQAEIDEYDPLTSGPRAHELARAGVMPEALRAAVRDAGLRQIVEPGLNGMIEHAQGRTKRNAA